MPKLTETLKDTHDLRRLLLVSLDQLVNKEITPNEARARAWLVREVLDTMRLEMIAARTGLGVYAPVELLPKIVSGTKT